MSQTIIDWEVRRNGVLADATSVVLEDPSDLFGVLRKDTSGVVVVAGTPFVHVSTGVYQYIFTDPAPNLEYNYYVKVVLDSETYYYERDYSTAESLLEISGRYGTSKCMYQRFGLDNINLWAAYGGQDTAVSISQRLREVLEEADSYIDDVLRGGPYVLPFCYPIPRTIQEVSCKLAGISLYEARGVEDFEGFHRLSAMRLGVDDTLRRIRSGRIQLAPQVGNFSMASVSLDDDELDPDAIFSAGRILRWPNT